MLLSRSSNSAVTAPPRRVSRSSSRTTPLPLTRSRPLDPAAIQTLDSRSRIMASAPSVWSAAGSPDCVTSVPVHRAIPLSVPIQRSPFGPGRRQLIFRFGQPLHDPRHAASLHPAQTGVARAEPDVAVRRFGHGYDEGGSRNGSRGRDRRDLAAAIGHGAVLERGEKHDVLPRPEHGRHDGLRQADLREDAFEGPVVIPQQRGASQPRPQASVRSGRDAEHRWTRPGIRSSGLQQTEAQAVETDKPLLGADPQIAVGRLGDRVHRTAGESPLAAPLVADVLREGAIRIDRVRPIAQAQHHDGGQHCAGPKPSGSAARENTGTAQ